jgi:hypothetical protein
MKEERFNELMRDAAETYRRPPDAPLDEMWESIEASLDESGDRDQSPRGGSLSSTHTRRPWPLHVWQQQWFRIAAALVIGVGLGRMWTARQHSKAPTGQTEVATARHDSSLAAVPNGRPSLAEPYNQATTKYLGQTAALLIALPNEVRAGRADAQFISRAGDLLLTTRLLLDSPASRDPAMRNLLEDLELVLAQVVTLRTERSRAELDLINQALEQRDVMPRLQSAVADISADDD